MRATRLKIWVLPPDSSPEDSTWDASYQKPIGCTAFLLPIDAGSTLYDLCDCIAHNFRQMYPDGNLDIKKILNGDDLDLHLGLTVGDVFDDYIVDSSSSIVKVLQNSYERESSIPLESALRPRKRRFDATGLSDGETQRPCGPRPVPLPSSVKTFKRPKSVAQGPGPLQISSNLQDSNASRLNHQKWSSQQDSQARNQQRLVKQGPLKGRTEMGFRPRDDPFTVPKDRMANESTIVTVPESPTLVNSHSPLQVSAISDVAVHQGRGRETLIELDDSQDESYNTVHHQTRPGSTDLTKSIPVTPSAQDTNVPLQKSPVQLSPSSRPDEHRSVSPLNLRTQHRAALNSPSLPHDDQSINGRIISKPAEVVWRMNSKTSNDQTGHDGPVEALYDKDSGALPTHHLAKSNSSASYNHIENHESTGSRMKQQEVDTVTKPSHLSPSSAPPGSSRRSDIRIAAIGQVRAIFEKVAEDENEETAQVPIGAEVLGEKDFEEIRAAKKHLLEEDRQRADQFALKRKRLASEPSNEARPSKYLKTDTTIGDEKGGSPNTKIPQVLERLDVEQSSKQQPSYLSTTAQDVENYASTLSPSPATKTASVDEAVPDLVGLAHHALDAASPTTKSVSVDEEVPDLVGPANHALDVTTHISPPRTPDATTKRSPSSAVPQSEVIAVESSEIPRVRKITKVYPPGMGPGDLNLPNNVTSQMTEVEHTDVKSPSASVSSTSDKALASEDEDDSGSGSASASTSQSGSDTEEESASDSSEDYPLPKISPKQDVENASVMSPPDQPLSAQTTGVAATGEAGHP
ncbi:MAG: hypothetical protein M1825_004792, partial [Sarcosagium campestre]